MTFQGRRIQVPPDFVFEVKLTAATINERGRDVEPDDTTPGDAREVIRKESGEPSSPRKRKSMHVRESDEPSSGFEHAHHLI